MYLSKMLNLDFLKFCSINTGVPELLLKLLSFQSEYLGPDGDRSKAPFGPRAVLCWIKRHQLHKKEPPGPDMELNWSCFTCSHKHVGASQIYFLLSYMKTAGCRTGRDGAVLFCLRLRRCWRVLKQRPCPETCGQTSVKHTPYLEMGLRK